MVIIASIIIVGWIICFVVGVLQVVFTEDRSVCPDSPEYMKCDRG